MAASITRCSSVPSISKFVNRLVFLSGNGAQKRCFSAEQNATAFTEDSSTENSSIEDLALKDELTRLRDVSRLSPRLKQQLRKERPDIDKAYKLTKNYSRRLYGQMGSASGINPQILWPTVEELRSKIEFEKQFEPSFKAKMKKVKKWENKRVTKLEKRKAKVDKAMAEMPKLIQQYYSKIETAENQVKAEQEKLAQLNREATEIYGPMKRSDSRLKEYVSKRLREERIAERQAKADKRKSKKQKAETEEKTGDKITAEVKLKQ
ncbi:large ribosomal subunit protein mL64-like [Ylistrum balloti]|uniref:large ribosomal subunit protein mL64-like n=1 Tax=Ylistrum balloti TaxID=509963 RepID=UPI00290583F5|nr:large ribosomal subunit protein mL64-like [Ylistrum balloti]